MGNFDNRIVGLCLYPANTTVTIVVRFFGRGRVARRGTEVEMVALGWALPGPARR